MAPVRVKIVGAGGYGGVGTVEMLSRHPEAELVALVEVGAGGTMSQMWPHLEGVCDLPFVEAGSPEADVDCDVVFYCTPDRVGQAAAPGEVAKGRRVIDFSGDFRSPDTATYEEYATRLGLEPKHLSPDLLESSVYGVPELYREQIARTTVVANPGCFAVGSIIALAPAVRERLIDPSMIAIDAKTAVSGAGKKARPQFHYPEIYDNMLPYRLTGHQHVMEIETQLGLIHGDKIPITFTPQVVPMARGILGCMYARMMPGVDEAKVLDVYRAAYDGEPFVRVYDRTGPAGTSVVRGTNRVNLIVACDERTGVFRVISHIDNLVKGQAGSAVQNMNVLFGMPETMGLDQPAQHP
jgi:N-acetyl-gamma-glutamyl-phosphate reductase